MAYRTKTYIAADWDHDKDAVDQIYKWKNGNGWSLDFHDAHELTQARDSSLPCSIKASLKSRMDVSKNFVLITTNEHHPAFRVNEANLHIIFQKELSLTEALKILRSEFGCERLTIQSGGTLNGLFLREKLFDYVDIVVAPVLVGGKHTSTLIDGKSLMSESELPLLGVLKLLECKVLENSYLRLRYQVIG